MRVLAVDSSTPDLCVGAYEEGKIYSFNLETGRQLSGLISVTIKRILESLNWQVSEIDYFGLGLGPGSFTGLRVSAATIKGLSWASGKPVVGVSTLDILARAVREGGADIVPVIDAKRALVYSGTFRNIGSRLKRVRPYKLLSPESLLKTLKPNSILLGDGAALYREKLSGRIKGLRFLDKDFSRPNAHNLIELVLGDIRRCKFSDAFKIEPIYLYPKECQIKAKGKR